MNSTLIAAVVVFALAPPASPQGSRAAGQPGASQSEKLQAEVIVSTLSAAELAKQIAAATVAIEHKSEVARGGPATAVVRATGCMKDTAGACQVKADVVIYKPDGSVLQEAKGVDLTAGRATLPITLDAGAATGVYKIAITVRDATARRFATVDRQFGVR